MRNSFFRRIAGRYRRRIRFTLGVAFLESISILLFPLVIGLSVDGVLSGRPERLALLGLLCLAVLIFGAGRRFVDTRVYSRIFVELAGDLARDRDPKDAARSAANARVAMLEDVVDFFENGFPEVLIGLVGLTGALVILFATDVRLFGICLLSVPGILLVYGSTTRRSLRLNRRLNDALERQVEVLASPHRDATRFFRILARWSVRLSDLETLNFSLAWALLSGILVASVFVAAGDGFPDVGAVVSSVMYVFTVIDQILMLPFYYQQLIRIREIGRRLDG